MAPPRSIPERDPARHRPDGRGEGAGASVVRRAPFSDNPEVGIRGQRTRQRILDAALRVFGDEGYHGGSIDRIAKVAGCSRVSFYQYFASKEDVFRELAEQLARQVTASTEALSPVTADGEGWATVRAWMDRYAEIYERYEPVFHAYETDEVLAKIAWRTGADVVGKIHARVVTTSVPPRQLDPVLGLFLECLNHTLGVVAVLRSVAPEAYPSGRVETAVTDVFHRTLFGVRSDVNVHEAAYTPALPVPFGEPMRSMLEQGDGALESNASANHALAALLASGRDVLVSRGYHNTRVDDLVEAAGVSHGVFYRYFTNKSDLARILTTRAVREVGTTLLEIPDLFGTDAPSGRTLLRRWLRRYNTAHANEAALLRVWLDGALQDPSLQCESAPPLDWGRRRMARYLGPRAFGDVDMDAVVMVALLGVFGARPRPPAEVEAAALLIERGLLGREPHREAVPRKRASDGR